MHRSRALIPLILTLVLTLGTVAPALAMNASDAQKHRQAAEDARNKAAAAEKKADELRDETAVLDQRIEQLQKEAAALEPQISEATGRTKKLHDEVVKLDSEITELKAEIVKTQAEYEHQRALLSDRVQAAYKQGTWFYLDILFSSQNFNDLIARTELVNRVIESNNNIAEDLHITKESLSASEVKLQRSLDSVKVKRREAEDVEKRLKGLHASRKASESAQKSALQQKTALIEKNESDAEKLRIMAADEERESKRIEAELAALARRANTSSSSGSGRYTGTMTWPVPGFSNVSSPFGWRTHPIFGTRKLHSGMDISGGGRSISGAAIVAADGGTVIYTGYRGGYGNTVMVDHGGGIVTLYPHMLSGSFAVSTGQAVSKGQRLGGVGSTGYSTGPHLHFEVRVNGAPQNPANYVSAP